MLDIHNDNNSSSDGSCSCNHHHHNHAEISNIKVLIFAFILTFSFMFVEFIAGFFSKSLALISDAGHMLSDSTALFLALIAVFIGTKEANLSKTFGYKRIETIVAFLNALGLLILAGFIFKEGIERIFNPVQIIVNQLLIVAIIGLIINILMALILFKNSKDSINVRGAFLHVLGDLLGSIGVILAGLIIKFTGWLYADPLISIVIATLILISSIRLLKETLHILMEGTPKHIEPTNVTKEIMSLNENIINVHDLHIWSLNESKLILTCHIVIKEMSKSQEIIKQVRSFLVEKFNIEHSTLQIEPSKCNLNCCRF